jgi:hypothetical protein
MLDRVSKLMKPKRLKFGLRESSHRSIYRYTKLIRYRIHARKSFICFASDFVMFHVNQKKTFFRGNSETEI